MHEIHSSKPPVVTGICDPNKSRARNHHSLKLGLKLKYLNEFSIYFLDTRSNGSVLQIGLCSFVCPFAREDLRIGPSNLSNYFHDV